MGAINKFLKNRDIFGQPVELNFNRKGPTANTALGGCVSLLVKFMIFAYFVIKVRDLVELRNPTIKVFEETVPANVKWEESYENMRILPFMMLRNTTFDSN